MNRTKATLSVRALKRLGCRPPTWLVHQQRWWVFLVFAPCALAAWAVNAAVLSADFAVDPKISGWKSFGDSSLFEWNRSNQALEVTWDSSHSNSFFYLPLRTILTKGDDFSFDFEIRLHDIRVGISGGKMSTFEIAVGLFNSHNITNANYFRGAGRSSTYGVRNLVEFDYFPGAGVIEPTFASTVVSTNNCIYPAHNFPLEMTSNDLFRITFSYTASNQTLRTTALKNGSPFGLSPNNSLQALSLKDHPDCDLDFRVDAFGISSYSDAIQTGPAGYWGSILAHGAIDNVMLTLPPPPLEQILLFLTNSTPSIQFTSRTNWNYALQRSLDLISWIDSGPTVAGTGGILVLGDSSGIDARAFYRVRLDRP